jgi:chaperonin GroEL
VTVARHIFLEDPAEDVGAQVLVEASMKTNEQAGDGTTGTVVIASQLIEDCFAKLETGMIGNQGDAMSIFREIQQTKEEVVAKIKERAKEVTPEDLRNIITTSLENKEYGDKIADLIEQVGVDGYISVEENWATKYGIDIEVVNGMKFLGTYATPYSITTAKREAIYEDVPVLVCNHHIETTAVFERIWKEMISEKKQKLVIIAEKFEKKAIEMIAMNVINMNRARAEGKPMNFIEVLAVKAPSLTTQEFEDLATFVGATFVDKNAQGKLKNVGLNECGFAKKIIVTDSDVNILGGKGNDTTLVTERIEKLKDELAIEKDTMFAEKLKRRIASLSSGVGVIRVGAMTEQEQEYWRYKIEDAVYAAKAAQKEGYVKGGGLCLSDIADELGEGNVLYHALKSTNKKILDNAGGDFEIDENVIDPAMVIRMSLENACSAGGTLITCGGLITDENPDVWEKFIKNFAKANSKMENVDFRDEREVHGKGTYGFNE